MHLPKIPLIKDIFVLSSADLVIEGIMQIREKISDDLKGWNSTEEIKRLRDSRWAGIPKNDRIQ